MKKGSIVGAWLAPHPPHLVYAENPSQNEPRAQGGWENLRWAYQNCREKIQLQKPDVLIVHSPHWQTTVGHHVTVLKRLEGLSVDPIFPHLFRYHYDVKFDEELGKTIYEHMQLEGLACKKLDNENFILDYGTIVSLHMVEPSWQIPVVVLSAHDSPYFDDLRIANDEMIKLGRATRLAIEKQGRRAVLLASSSLSHMHFPQEPNPDLPEDMSLEHIFSQKNYQWDMRILDLMREGKIDAIMDLYPTYIAETAAEVKAGGLVWLLSALNFAPIRAKIYGYGSVIGTGNAVVEWDPQTIS